MKRQKQIKTKNQRLRITLSIMVLTFCTVFLFLSNSANAQTFTYTYSPDNDNNGTIDSAYYGICIDAGGQFNVNDIVVFGVGGVNDGNTYTVGQTVNYASDSVVLRYMSDGYYGIWRVKDLRALSAYVMHDSYCNGVTTIDYTQFNTYGKKFKLLNNIAFADADNIYTNTDYWEGASNLIPIGGWINENTTNYSISTNQYKKHFCGTFEGQNNTITGLMILKSTGFNEVNNSTNRIGLFGSCNGIATIQNINMVNSKLSGSNQVATICGGGTAIIKNCSIKTLLINGSYSGGIIGYAINSSIDKCKVEDANIIATTGHFIGGIVGIAENTTTNHCYVLSTNIYNISGNSVGGLVGWNRLSSSIKNCYVVSIFVSGWRTYGGFCGDNDASSIENCYSTALVSRNNSNNYAESNLYFGGFVGYMHNNGTFSNCYYINSYNVDNLITATPNYSGITAHSSAEMKLPDFVTIMNNSQNPVVYQSDALFGGNQGYPIFTTQTATMADPYTIHKGEETIIPSTAAATDIPSSITIEDGGSLIDNANIVSNNVTIQRKLKVKEWNLFGPTTTGQTYALLNNNVGTVSSGQHDMVITPFDYTANTWGSYITPTTINNSLTIGTSSFVYPLENIITITGGTVTDVTTNSTEYTIVSQTAAPYTSNVTFGTETGNLDLNNTGTANASSTGTGAVTGKWFALSNPYTGKLKPNEICTSIMNTQGESAVYTYNATSGAWEVPTYVYPGQGFMVASEGNATTLSGTLTKATRTAKSSGTTPSYITFTCQANNTSKEAFARISEQASNGFDQKDAYVLLSSNNENLVEPYFLVENHAVLKNIYKTMPYYTPMNFHASKGSNTTLTTTNIPENVNVSIIDLSNGTETALENGSSFNFVANQGENEGRFVVKFAKNNVGIENNAEENNISLAMYPNPATTSTTLFIDGLTNDAQVSVCDVQGRSINNYTINKGQSTLKINTSNLASGIYYIRVVSNNLTKTEKLVVK